MSEKEELYLSEDQGAAFEHIAGMLAAAGIDLANGKAKQGIPNDFQAYAVMGKAGSGKTVLLARLAQAISATNVQIIGGEYEPKRKSRQRSLAILAPTNKAASVLRLRGIPATTIHRILYRPVYDPELEQIAEWLIGEAERPKTVALDDSMLDHVRRIYEQTDSIPAALASAGIRGSDFIRGWTRREGKLDIALVDEASMLDRKQFEDLQEIFPRLFLFGDPAQLAPVGEAGQMVFDLLDGQQKRMLSRVHRQEAGNPILDLAHSLADPELDFPAFEAEISRLAEQDSRIVVAERADSSMMARAPMLVWRNATRARLIAGFRYAHNAPSDELLPGEPLICDGIELPAKHRRQRLDLEARGLIKGAQAIYLGPGRKPGFARLYVLGAEEPRLSAASIIKIERPDEAEPLLASAARMGAAFLHAAAVTIHKAQGSQWQEVQVYAPDISAAARTGRSEAGQPLWKRLAYVAITRAEERLIWVTRNRLSRPSEALSTEDLEKEKFELSLMSAESERAD